MFVKQPILIVWFVHLHDLEFVCVKVLMLLCILAN